MARTKSNGTNTSTATIGFEAKLWLTAEQAVPAPHFAEAEYNGGRPQGLFGLIFLKYISETFEEHRAKLLAGQGDYAGANDEDPAEARWSHLQAGAEQPTIGKTADDAMVAIERDNPRLKGASPRTTPAPASTPQRATARLPTAKPLRGTFAQRKTTSPSANSSI